MDVTYAVAAQHGLTPFAVMDVDKDRVIMVINYLMEKGEKAEITSTVAKNATVKQSKNDGFWDF